MWHSVMIIRLNLKMDSRTVKLKRKRRAVFGPLGLLFMFEFINLYQLFEDGELFTFKGLRILFALFILVFLVVIFSKNLKKPAR